LIGREQGKLVEFIGVNYEGDESILAPDEKTDCLAVFQDYRLASKNAFSPHLDFIFYFCLVICANWKIFKQ